MAMLTALSALVAEGEGGHGFTRPLPMPPEVFGIIAIVVGVLLLVTTFFWRHSAPVPIDAEGHGGHGAHDEHGAHGGHGHQHGGHH